MKFRGINEFRDGGVGLGQGIAPQPFGKKVRGYGGARARSEPIKIAEIVEMGQCEAEKLGIDRKTRWRMRRGIKPD